MDTVSHENYSAFPAESSIGLSSTMPSWPYASLSLLPLPLMSAESRNSEQMFTAVAQELLSIQPLNLEIADDIRRDDLQTDGISHLTHDHGLLETQTPSQLPILSTFVSGSFPAILETSGLSKNLTSLPPAIATEVSPFSKLYVFGDSLSDPGNLFNLTEFAQPIAQLLGINLPIVPGPPYEQGHFSNGPIWVDYLAADLNLTVTASTDLSVLLPFLPLPSPLTITLDGLEISPFFQGQTTTQGVNFAFGGAGTDYYGPLEIGPGAAGLQQQVEWFVEDHQSAREQADPEALYLVWAGANDYIGDENPQPRTSVNNITTALTDLYESGARHFLVSNLPDLGQTPLASALGPEAALELTQTTEKHNGLLAAKVDHLTDTLTGSSFTLLDVNALFDEVLLHPRRFGFTNVTDAYLDVANPQVSPDRYLFWDDLHPTTGAHEMLADWTLAALTGQMNSHSLPTLPAVMELAL